MFAERAAECRGFALKPFDKTFLKQFLSTTAIQVSELALAFPECP